MQIKNMRLISAGKLKAFFDWELDSGIVIKGFKIAEGPTGMFVGCPSEKDKDGHYWDRVFIPRELKDELQTVALGHFEGMLAGAPQSQVPSSPADHGDLPF